MTLAPAGGTDLKVTCDVGGTFTDVVVSGADGDVRISGSR